MYIFVCVCVTLVFGIPKDQENLVRPFFFSVDKLYVHLYTLVVYIYLTDWSKVIYLLINQLDKIKFSSEPLLLM